jgi:hypothetical protein
LEVPVTRTIELTDDECYRLRQKAQEELRVMRHYAWRARNPDKNPYPLEVVGLAKLPEDLEKDAQFFAQEAAALERLLAKLS